MIGKTTKRFRRSFGMVLLFATVGLASAGPDPAGVFARRAGAEFRRAQIRFESATNDPTAAWQFARACFDFADFATNDIQRAEIAQQGIAACQLAITNNPALAPARYYLGMNLGRLADTKRNLVALRMVKEMEREFKTSSELDRQFDYAGPARNLGLLYRDAPGWPASIGSRRKAREWLERAVKLAPDYPENQLNLLESHLQWNERETAAFELKTLDSIWLDALKKFAGEAWEQSQADWSARRDVARKKLDKILSPAKSPRNTR